MRHLHEMIRIAASDGQPDSAASGKTPGGGQKGKAQELWEQIGGNGNVADQRFVDVESLDVTGWRVAKGASLFPRPAPGA